MPKTTYLANKILDHIHGGPDFARPATTYLGVFTVMPTIAGSGTGTEVVVARIAVTNNLTNWPTATAGQKSNATLIDWGVAAFNWGTIVAIAEFDASSGGNMLEFGALTNPITINSGQPFSVPVGGGIFTET